jgi:hypothetical protein
LNEDGSGVLLSRSAFAHGYRHGYEEGYHQGNVDINMGRIPRPQAKGQLRGLKLKLGYAPAFGSKRSFEDGFTVGLRAGYSDGYAGQSFRAVDLLRQMAVELAPTPPPEDPSGVYFDQGLAAGYLTGWQQGASSKSGVGRTDSAEADCGQPGRDIPAPGSYCEGYQRGFVLGKTDIVVLRRDSIYLEASK